MHACAEVLEADVCIYTYIHTYMQNYRDRNRDRDRDRDRNRNRDRDLDHDHDVCMQAHTDCTSALNAIFFAVFPMAASTSNILSAGDCSCMQLHAYTQLFINTQIHT